MQHAGYSPGRFLSLSLLFSVTCATLVASLLYPNPEFLKSRPLED
jgi:hypothetical protein